MIIAIAERPTKLIATVVTLVLCSTLGLAADDVTFVKLFVIQRSKNANEVHYDARVRKDGSLDPKQPVVSYWINKAEGGGRGPITFFQRFAYGHSTTRGADGRWTLRLTAFKERAMEIVRADTEWRVRAQVGGKLTYLKRLYVATNESGWVPKVLYVEAFGDDVVSGAPVQEHIKRH